MSRFRAGRRRSILSTSTARSASQALRSPRRISFTASMGPPSSARTPFHSPLAVSSSSVRTRERRRFSRWFISTTNTGEQMRRLLLCALLAPTWAAASCGSAFCSVNTSWDLQGAWTEPGTRLDFRYEYVNQDQPMSGSRKVGVGEIPKHHDEVYTRNRNYLTAIDTTLGPDWGVNVLVPVVSREHFHIHNHMGAPLEERWDFTALGDVRVLARRKLASFEDAEPSVSVAALQFGLKLPTGKTDVKNGDGDPAERSLQPGSGTTDFLIGASYSKLQPTRNLSTFVQGQIG